MGKGTKQDDYLSNLLSMVFMSKKININILRTKRMRLLIEI